MGTSCTALLPLLGGRPLLSSVLSTDEPSSLFALYLPLVARTQLLPLPAPFLFTICGVILFLLQVSHP